MLLAKLQLMTSCLYSLHTRSNFSVLAVGIF